MICSHGYVETSAGKASFDQSIAISLFLSLCISSQFEAKGREVAGIRSKGVELRNYYGKEREGGGEIGKEISLIMVKGRGWPEKRGFERSTV